VHASTEPRQTVMTLYPIVPIIFGCPLFVISPVQSLEARPRDAAA
jgi:hypothetical protein